MRHFNPSIAEDQTRILNLKGQENLSEVSDLIQPVINITRDSRILGNGTMASGGPVSASIFTAPSDKDTYLTGISYGLIKDVNATATLFNIRGTFGGVVNTSLKVIPCLTLTAQQTDGNIQFNPPMKIDRGSQLQISTDTNVANWLIKVTAYGYNVETTKGV